jgi:hypothetical protein
MPHQQLSELLPPHKLVLRLSVNTGVLTACYASHYCSELPLRKRTNCYVRFAGLTTLRAAQLLVAYTRLHRATAAALPPATTLLHATAYQGFAPCSPQRAAASSL